MPLFDADCRHAACHSTLIYGAICHAAAVAFAMPCCCMARYVYGADAR